MASNKCNAEVISELIFSQCKFKGLNIFNNFVNNWIIWQNSMFAVWFNKPFASGDSGNYSAVISNNPL